MGFTKLDEGIVHSSIWSEALATRVLWVTMLAMADSKGFVSSSRSGLLRAANIPLEEFDSALGILEAPDPDSRSPEYDGRRVQKCDGGWTVLNYLRYREFTYSGSKEAIKKRRQRDKKGHKGDMSTKGGDISASASASGIYNSNKILRGGTGEGKKAEFRTSYEKTLREALVEKGDGGFELEAKVKEGMEKWDASRTNEEKVAR